MADRATSVAEEKCHVHCSEERRYADKCPPTQTAYLRITDEGRKAKYQVEEHRDDTLIEELHDVLELVQIRLEQSYEYHHRSLDEKLESDLPPEEVVHEDKGEAHYQAAQEKGCRDQQDCPLALFKALFVLVEVVDDRADLLLKGIV